MAVSRATVITSPASHSGATVAVAATSTAILTDFPRRRGAWISNTSSSATVTLNFGGVAVSGAGMVIQPNTTVNIFPWTGPVNGISSTGTVNVGIVEL
jgi:hypothetical protein